MSRITMSRTARERFGPAGTPKVIVVGGGLGGIAAGVKMKKAGIETFIIFEKSGHLPFIEEPDNHTGLVTDFLQN